MPSHINLSAFTPKRKHRGSASDSPKSSNSSSSRKRPAQKDNESSSAGSSPAAASTTPTSPPRSFDEISIANTTPTPSIVYASTESTGSPRARKRDRVMGFLHRGSGKRPKRSIRDLNSSFDSPSPEPELEPKEAHEGPAPPPTITVTANSDTSDASSSRRSQNLNFLSPKTAKARKLPFKLPTRSSSLTASTDFPFRENDAAPQPAASPPPGLRVELPVELPVELQSHASVSSGGDEPNVAERDSPSKNADKPLPALPPCEGVANGEAGVDSVGPLRSVADEMRELGFEPVFPASRSELSVQTPTFDPVRASVMSMDSFVTAVEDPSDREVRDWNVEQLTTTTTDSDEHMSSGHPHSHLAPMSAYMEPSSTLAYPASDGSITENAQSLSSQDKASADEGSHKFNNVYIPAPLCISTTGPPELSSELQKGKMCWQFDRRKECLAGKWQTDPCIDTIKKIVQPHYEVCHLPNDDIKVKFLSEGAWNKVYTISTIDEATGDLHECIFRCTLPDHPWFKIQSEAATMEYVRRRTQIPVPKVYAFDSSMENPLGFEWILVEKIKGTKYCDVENTLSFDARVKLYRQIAEWVDQLARLTFDKIGGLYHNWSSTVNDIDSYKIGPMAASPSTYDLRLDYPIYRGPYSSLEEFYHAHINVTHLEALDPRQKERVEYRKRQKELEELSKADDAGGNEEDADAGSNERDAVAESNEGDANTQSNDAQTDAPTPNHIPETQYDLQSLEGIPKMCLALQSILPAILKGKHLGPNSTHLYHFDMSKHNILIDDEGNAAALIDWESVYATATDMIPAYPAIIVEEEEEEPEPWAIIGPKDPRRIRHEQKWEETLLKREYEKRMEELDSPHLATTHERDPDLVELDDYINRLGFLYRRFDFVKRIREQAQRIF